MTGIRDVTIVGTGLIGRGWAVAFARAGWNVALWDASPDAAQAAVPAINRSIGDMAAAGLKPSGPVVGSLRVAATLEDAAANADYVQECVVEDLQVKRSVAAQIDAVAPGKAIIGSSSSTIPGSLFLNEIPGRARCIIAHPANPPHLMPVVEVVPSHWHDEAITHRTCAILREIGQVPVVIRKEIEGFVMNRLQAAVINEAVALVGNGVIAPADLDAVMKHSLGLRWAFMGPFETMDLNAPGGFADYAGRYGHLYQQMGRDLMVSAPWQPETIGRIEDDLRAVSARSEIAARMHWRDKALIELQLLARKINDEAGNQQQ
jgi:3-hydroxyacyl-CoA dehydrogenase